MSHNNMMVMRTVLVEREVEFTFDELCHACLAHADEIMALVEEGVLNPSGDASMEWRFPGNQLRRARKALSLGRDLQLNAAGVALVLDLLDELEALRLHAWNARSR